MKEWKYLVLRKVGKLFSSEQMDELGEVGWELVTIKDAYGMSTSQLKRPVRYYIFKRLVED